MFDSGQFYEGPPLCKDPFEELDLLHAEEAEPGEHPDGEENEESESERPEEDPPSGGTTPRAKASPLSPSVHGGTTPRVRASPTPSSPSTPPPVPPPIVVDIVPPVVDLDEHPPVVHGVEEPPSCAASSSGLAGPAPVPATGSRGVYVPTLGISGVSLAVSNASFCLLCQTRIPAGSERLLYHFSYVKPSRWLHPKCATRVPETIQSRAAALEVLLRLDSGTDAMKVAIDSVRASL